MSIMTWENSPLDDLVGKTIQKVLYSDGYIMFVHEDFDMSLYRLESDCCSETWLYELSELQSGVVKNGIVV